MRAVRKQPSTDMTSSETTIDSLVRAEMIKMRDPTSATADGSSLPRSSSPTLAHNECAEFDKRILNDNEHSRTQIASSRDNYFSSPTSIASIGSSATNILVI